MTPANTPALYPIRAVARLTGLSVDTLRAWERRYGAVTPSRDDRGRLYSEADVARLRLLQRAVAAGHSVGRIAALGDGDLRRLAEAGPSPDRPAAPVSPLDTAAFTAALQSLDTAALDREFSRLATLLPPVELVRDALLPAMRAVGDAWHRTRGGIAHEHLMASSMRHLLGSFLRLYSRPDAAVRILFATPSGERHELGILAAAMLAACHGIGVSYVGPDLPAAEIVAAADAARADVLVLGLTLSGPEAGAEGDLETIAKDLPRRTELWVGGAGVSRHAAALGGRALEMPDFDVYLQHLQRLTDAA